MGVRTKGVGSWVLGRVIERLEMGAWDDDQKVCRVFRVHVGRGGGGGW